MRIKKRIAKNTIMLYARMMFTMLVSLYTTRVILKVLGVDDYGLLGLVGAIIGMMGIITSLLSGGTCLNKSDCVGEVL